jgi:hypothetical protein
MVHARQSRPHSGLVFQGKALTTFSVFAGKRLAVLSQIAEQLGITEDDFNGPPRTRENKTYPSEC